MGRAEVHPPDGVLIRHVGESMIEPTVFGRIERSLVAESDGSYRLIYALYLSLGRRPRSAGDRHQRIELDVNNALEWFRSQVAGLETLKEKEDEHGTHP